MQWFEMAGLSVILVVFLISTLVLVLRWFRHRERLAMIRQGLIPDDAGAPAGRTRKRRGLLFGGLSIGALGLLLLCAAGFVAVPSLRSPISSVGLSSLGLVPLPGLLVAFMGVGLLILYVWAQPTVERRARAAAVEADDPVAELEPIDAALAPAEPWDVPVEPAADDAAPLDAKAPPEARG